MISELALLITVFQSDCAASVAVKGFNFVHGFETQIPKKKTLKQVKRMKERETPHAVNVFICSYRNLNSRLKFLRVSRPHCSRHSALDPPVLFAFQLG